MMSQVLLLLMKVQEIMTQIGKCNNDDDNDDEPSTSTVDEGLGYNDIDR